MLWNFVGKMKNYHVYTKGLEGNLIFRCREDYIVGMNYIAVCLSKCDVRIMAFVLMSNHVHFVVRGSYSEAMKFIDLYKRMVSRFISLKYGCRALLRRVLTSYDEISNVDDGLKKCIAYVLDNPVKAGLQCVPQGYEWSSARCYFSDIDSFKNTVSAAQLSTRRLEVMLHSKERVPALCRLNDDGYICPKSYVDYQFVEKLFRKPKTFEFYLSTSASSRTGKKDVLLFSDQVVKSAVGEILMNKYGCEAAGMLEDDMRDALVNDVRKVFNAPANQIARVLGLPLNLVLGALK